MDAPAKSGGTRKTRRGRQLIGRLSTLPPIEFLKKHNPLRRRRTKPKLGFDQPPQEIRRLALPLRPPPPSLSMRLHARIRPGVDWIADRAVGAAMAVRHAGFVTLDRTQWVARAALALLHPPIRGAMSFAGSILVKLSRSRAVRAVAAGVDAVAGRVGALLRPAEWPATSTPALMQRAVRVKRLLVGTVVCEWTAAVGLVLLLAGLSLTGREWDRASVNVCGLILSLLSFAGLALLEWHARLVGAWRSLELFICGSCGGLRNFSPSLACPNCGTADQPVFPGHVPAAWLRGRELLGPLAVGGPALLAGALLCGGRLL